jgi:hypothetical protein
VLSEKIVSRTIKDARNLALVRLSIGTPRVRRALLGIPRQRHLSNCSSQSPSIQ